MNLEHRVGQYIALRDEIRRLEAEFDEKISPYKKTLEQLNLTLLQMLDSTKQESARTIHGTVYKTKKQSCSISDREAFWDHVVSTQNWDLIDKRANITGCVDYAEQHKTMPPGINYSAIWQVGVRRA